MDKFLFRKYLFTDSNTDTYSRIDVRFAFSVVMLKLLLTAIIATLSLIGVSKTIESFGYSYFAFYEMTLVISVLLFVDGFIDMIKMLKSMGRIQATQFDWIRKN